MNKKPNSMTATPLANHLPDEDTQGGRDILFVERLSLTNFRNYGSITLNVGPKPVVLTGGNGVGKTNILEAISLAMPGSGIRRAPYKDLSRAGADGGWAVALRLNSRMGRVDIGTGLQSTVRAGASGESPDYQPRSTRPERSGRIVRINGENKGGSGILSSYVDMVWVTPAMDGVFTGSNSERRRLIDRLVVCFDPSFRVFTGRFERAMQARNRLLSDGVTDPAQLEGFEVVMAQTATAVAAARVEAITALNAMITERKQRDTASAFPWSTSKLDGTLEQALMTKAAVDVEDDYIRHLHASRERDRAAGRTLEGPHRSDLKVIHGPKNMPARLCSTGEQKVLLVGLILAQAELIARRHEGCAPIILLDEVAAHLDIDRRRALFDEILRLGSQAWMTGTDLEAFAHLRGSAQLFNVQNGSLEEI